ncbi:TPA: hypothetical protein DCQ44_01875 [Candidatus Taylorbacteria bacterium]|nr:hypothetical protein [Candidatus Taylorbacteria bacterium]
MATKKTFRISTGPSKFDLMLSLFDGTDHEVGFTFKGRLGEEDTPASEIIISAVRRGSKPDLWLIEGKCARMGNEEILVAGEYSTKTRTGLLEFTYS